MNVIFQFISLISEPNYQVSTKVQDPLTGVEKDCDDTILIVTENGYGKRTPVGEYRKQSRGGVGIITQKITDKVGGLIAARLVKEPEEVLIMTNQGQSIRMKVSDISQMGRNTQGVRLINLKSGEYVTDVALIDDDETEE